MLTGAMSLGIGRSFLSGPNLAFCLPVGCSKSNPLLRISESSLCRLSQSRHLTMLSLSLTTLLKTSVGSSSRTARTYASLTRVCAQRAGWDEPADSYFSEEREKDKLTSQSAGVRKWKPPANKSVIARASTSFSTEETTLVEEGSLQEVGRTTLDEIDVSKLEGNMRKLPGSNIVMDVNLGRRHLIKEVEFIKSSPRESECPTDGLPEFALVGRSNVGKSSLINALVNRKEMAQTSKRPGKTQLINHFRVNKSWYLVDLPGYGYAKAPVAVKTEWNDFTKSYFLNRKTLVSVMLLVDASIPPLQIDLDCADWLGRNKIPVTLVFTKCDRRKKKKNGGKPPDENVAEFEKQLQESYAQTPPWVMTSSSTGQGKDELLKHMARLLDYWDN